MKWIVTWAVLLAATSAWALGTAVNYTAFTAGQTLTAALLNNLQTHYTAYDNEARAFFPGTDSLKIPNVLADSLRERTPGLGIILVGRLKSRSLADSIEAGMVNADSVHVLDLLQVLPAAHVVFSPGSTANISHAQIDTGAVDSLTLGLKMTALAGAHIVFSPGSTANISRVRIDSAQIDSLRAHRLNADSVFVPPVWATAPSTSVARKGMLYYDTDTDSLYSWSGTAWKNMGFLSSATATQLHSLAGTKDTTASIRPDTVVGAPLFTGKPNFSVGFSTGGSPTKITDIATYDAIVDSAGAGNYTTLLAALNAGAKYIGVRKGTYPHTTAAGTISQSNITIEGTYGVIFSGTPTPNTALTLAGSFVAVRGITCKTLAGGGGAGYAIHITGADNIIDNVSIPSSDNDGIRISGARSIIRGSKIYAADGYGITPRETGDDCLITGNLIRNCGGLDVYIYDSSTGAVVAGNRIEQEVGVSGAGAASAKYDSLNFIGAY